MPENVRSVWSEEDLDRALAALNADQQPDKGRLAATRTDLMAAAGLPAVPARRRRWPRLAAAAAVVAAVATGVLVIQSGGDNAPTAAAAALNSAADNITATDPVIEPGQYRYIATHAWTMASASMVDSPTVFSALVEELQEEWIPSDRREEWVERGGTTGNVTWLQGTAEEAEEAGIDPLFTKPNYENRAPCGDYHAAETGEEPCTGEAAWQVPTPDFLAAVPRDPAALYERLRADVGDRGEAHIVVYVADVLRTGQVPADLRASLYRALAMVPGLEITAEVANLDGKRGTAFGIDHGEERQDLIIDPATGEYIGERRVTTEGWDGIPPGTVIGYTSVSTAVVDEIGAKPAG